MNLIEEILDESKREFKLSNKDYQHCFEALHCELEIHLHGKIVLVLDKEDAEEVYENCRNPHKEIFKQLKAQLEEGEE